MGALTTCAVRHKLPDGSGQAVVGATADGGLFAAALLLDGQTAQALLAVQRALATELEHAAGLNPIAFRCCCLCQTTRCIFHQRLKTDPCHIAPGKVCRTVSIHRRGARWGMLRRRSVSGCESRVQAVADTDITACPCTGDASKRSQLRSGAATNGARR